jgi:hypothetical protein
LLGFEKPYLWTKVQIVDAWAIPEPVEIIEELAFMED